MELGGGRRKPLPHSHTYVVLTWLSPFFKKMHKGETKRIKIKLESTIEGSKIVILKWISKSKISVKVKIKNLLITTKNIFLSCGKLGRRSSPARWGGRGERERENEEEALGWAGWWWWWSCLFWKEEGGGGADVGEDICFNKLNYRRIQMYK